jgi:hypothetical protein
MKNTRKQKRVQKRKGVRKTRKQTMKRIRGGRGGLIPIDSTSGYNLNLLRDIVPNLFNEINSFYNYMDTNGTDTIIDKNMELKKLSNIYAYLNNYKITTSDHYYKDNNVTRFMYSNQDIITNVDKLLIVLLKCFSLLQNNEKYKNLDDETKIKMATDLINYNNNIYTKIKQMTRMKRKPQDYDLIVYLQNGFNEENTNSENSLYKKNFEFPHINKSKSA